MKSKILPIAFILFFLIFSKLSRPAAAQCTSPTSCNTGEIIMSANPSTVLVGQTIHLYLSGDATMWTGDTHPGVSGCSGGWTIPGGGVYYLDLYCTGQTAGTYNWTHTWQHCNCDPSHCYAGTCSSSVSYTVTCPAACSYPETNQSSINSFCTARGYSCPAPGTWANLTCTAAQGPTGCTWAAYGPSCAGPSCAGCACIAPTPTNTPVPTATSVPTRTPTPLPSATSVPTRTPTPVPTTTNAPSPTPTTATPTSTPFPTATSAPSTTPIPTYTPAPTPTPQPTSTPWPTNIPIPTVVPGITLFITQPPTTIMGRLDLTRVVQFIFNLLVAIGIIAALSYLLYGASRWISSGGDKALVESARSHVTHAVIGLIILLLSWVIVSLIMSILGAGTIPGTLTLPPLR